MASLVSHGMAGLALCSAVRPGRPPTRFWVLGALCAALPDADVVVRTLGVTRDSWLSHRGFTHSLCFAALLGAAVTWGAFRDVQLRGVRHRLWLCFTLATASHGLLDALTAYGPGVALLAPFSTERFFFPWRPLTGAVLGVGWSLLERVLAVVLNEAAWVWAPSLLLVAISRAVRRSRRKGIAA